MLNNISITQPTVYLLNTFESKGRHIDNAQIAASNMTTSMENMQGYINLNCQVFSPDEQNNCDMFDSVL